MISLGLMSPPRIVNQKSQTKTPKKQIRPSTSAITFRDREKPKEQGQGDGFQNVPDVDVSPAKKFKPSQVNIVEGIETIEDECVGIQKVRYVVNITHSIYVYFCNKAKKYLNPKNTTYVSKSIISVTFHC